DALPIWRGGGGAAVPGAPTTARRPRPEAGPPVPGCGRPCGASLGRRSARAAPTAASTPPARPEQGREDLPVHAGPGAEALQEATLLLLHHLRDARERHVDEAPAAPDRVPRDRDLDAVAAGAEPGDAEERLAPQRPLAGQLGGDALRQARPEASAGEDAARHVDLARQHGVGQRVHV